VTNIVARPSVAAAIASAAVEEIVAARAVKVVAAQVAAVLVDRVLRVAKAAVAAANIHVAKAANIHVAKAADLAKSRIVIATADVDRGPNGKVSRCRPRPVHRLVMVIRNRAAKVDRVLKVPVDSVGVVAADVDAAAKIVRTPEDPTQVASVARNVLIVAVDSVPRLRWRPVKRALAPKSAALSKNSSAAKIAPWPSSAPKLHCVTKL
jgi:hypothetical protein